MSELTTYIQKYIDESLLRTDVLRDELLINIKAANICEVLEFLKGDDKCSFKQLVDICAVDYPDREDMRFEVIYSLLSIEHNHRIKVKVHILEDAPIHSVTPIYKNAEWYEREIFDMFGIYFQENPNLCRILMSDDCDGYPLRKDFALSVDYKEYDFINNELTRGGVNG